jgi:hypothetical protein
MPWVADAKLKVRVGDRVPLNLHTYTVVGVTRGALDTNGEPLVYLSLPDAQEVLYQKIMKRCALSGKDYCALLRARGIYHQDRQKNCSPN